MGYKGADVLTYDVARPSDTRGGTRTAIAKHLRLEFVNDVNGLPADPSTGEVWKVAPMTRAEVIAKWRKKLRGKFSDRVAENWIAWARILTPTAPVE